MIQLSLEWLQHRHILEGSRRQARALPRLGLRALGALVCGLRLVLQKPLNLGLLVQVVDLLYVFHGMLNLVGLFRPHAATLGVTVGVRLPGVQVPALAIEVLLVLEPLNIQFIL